MSPERPQEPLGWITARRYADARLARAAYEAARDALLIEHDVDASVLRFTLNGVSHVAILGETPLDQREKELVAAAFGDDGEAVDVPYDITDRLRDRRKEMTGLGFDYVERRSGPDIENK
jgi:hypothetical protein